MSYWKCGRWKREKWREVAPGGGSNPTLAKSRGPALAASPLPLPLTE